MPTYATPGPIVATVQVAGAQVRVTASDRTVTVVLVEPIDAASRTDVKVATRTKVDFAGGRLSVKTTVPGDRLGSVAITIDLPAGSSLVAYLAHSDVRVDGELGDCELHMASGRVELDRITALHANIAAGDVTITHIAGPAHIDGSRGQIRIGRMTHGQAKPMNGSGDLEVGTSEGTAAWVDATSEGGSVCNSVPAQENPDMVDKTVTVHARTRHGDVIIRGAAS